MGKYIVTILAAILLMGCGSDQEPDHQDEQTETGETEERASVSFKDIDVKVEGDHMYLTGDAKTSEDEIFYELTQGEDVLKEETSINLEEGHLNWSSFEIKTKLPKDVAANEETPIVMLYVKGNNDKVVNPNYVPVDVLNY